MSDPPIGRDDDDYGAYVHVPFCAHKCDYCAFATWTGHEHLIDAYLAAVRREIRRAVDEGIPPLTSVFVGGGTPTLLRPDALAALIEELPTSPLAEVTVECNPESLTAAHIEAFRAAGVNRLSVGVQSMVDHVLEALGRRHDRSNAASAVALARAGGITNINLDVIYGAVGESVEDWRATLDEIVALEPEHISAYALTVEGGTPLAADASRHPVDDDQADMYVLAAELLGNAGFEWYEISNWAKPGRQCRHNQLYWSQGNYRGFGCAAHSHQDGRRWWNVRTPERFVELIERGAPPEAGSEVLAADTRRVEGLQLSLRTSRGVPADALSDEDASALEGLVERVDDRVFLTRAGRMLANEVAVRLH